MVTAVIGFALICSAQNHQLSSSVLDDHPSLYPPTEIRHFTLGYSEIVADLLWLRTIQDFDYCENRPAGALPSGAYKCNRGWVFHMIDSVTELAPNFRTPYTTGALVLSVIVNDVSGA
jgi:hypothetical protein